MKGASLCPMPEMVRPEGPKMPEAEGGVGRRVFVGGVSVGWEWVSQRGGQKRTWKREERLGDIRG